MPRFRLLLPLLVAVACGDTAPPIVARDIVVTAPAPGMRVAAAYLELTNRSGAPIRVTRVSSPNFVSVEIHETTIENGVARMRRIAALDIADGETVTFERGGKHLMLMQPVGGPDEVTLHFYTDDQLLLSVRADFEASAS